jgi:hypothetical protein
VPSSANRAPFKWRYFETPHKICGWSNFPLSTRNKSVLLRNCSASVCPALRLPRPPLDRTFRSFQTNSNFVDANSPPSFSHCIVIKCCRLPATDKTFSKSTTPRLARRHPHHHPRKCVSLLKTRVTSNVKYGRRWPPWPGATLCKV